MQGFRHTLTCTASTHIGMQGFRHTVLHKGLVTHILIAADTSMGVGGFLEGMFPIEL